MGQRKRRLEQFKSRNPVCCFCGTAATETVDHIPNRDCFFHRQAPEEFEFPACQTCNAKTRSVEQVAAFYLTLMARDGFPAEETDLKRRAIALRNNFPRFLPNMNLSANEKRKAFGYHDKRFQSSATFAEAPVIGIDREVWFALNCLSLKLLCALYYRHMSEPMPQGFFVAANSEVTTKQGVFDEMAPMLNSLPNFHVGQRRNTSLGQQFEYRWAATSPTDTRGFAYIASLRQAVVMTGVCIEKPTVPESELVTLQTRWANIDEQMTSWLALARSPA